MKIYLFQHGLSTHALSQAGREVFKGLPQVSAHVTKAHTTKAHINKAFLMPGVSKQVKQPLV